MGFLSTLGGLLSAAAPVGAGIATVLTGGAAAPLLMASLAGAGGVGTALGKLGQGDAAGNLAQANLNNTNDQIRQRAQADQQNALLTAAGLTEKGQNDAATQDLAQKQFSISSPSKILANAARGDAAANMQDVSINRPKGVPMVSFSGGLRPSLFGADTHQAGQSMADQALAMMKNPAAFAPLPSASPQILSPFQMTPSPTASLFDNIAGAAGKVGGIATGVMTAQDMIKKILAGQTPAATPDIPTNTGLPTNYGSPVMPGLPTSFGG